MGKTVAITTETIKECPNQAKHNQDLLNNLKANPHLLHLEPIDVRTHVYCPKCGEKLIDKTIEHATIVCERCGNAVYPDDSFCPNCGDRLRDPLPIEGNVQESSHARGKVHLTLL